MPPIQFEQALWGSHLRDETRDPDDYFPSYFSGFELLREAFDAEHLVLMREVKIAFEVATGPDSQDFQATVPFVHGFMLRGEMLPSGGFRCLASELPDYPSR